MNIVNIIIPVFNAPEFVAKCINSIRSKTDQFEFIYNRKIICYMAY